MNSTTRRVLATTGTAMAVAAIFVCALGAPAEAQAERKVSVLISPAGSGPYEAFAVMQTRAKDNHPWLRPVAVETPGFNYNVKYFAENPNLWKDTVIGSGSVLEWAANHGLKPFYPQPLKPAADYRIIGVMAVTGQLFVSTDPKIRKVEDFAGKRVSTGLLTQNEWGMYPRMMLDGLGLTSKLKALNHLGTDPNVEALLDGRADVATLVAFSSDGFKATITPSPFKLLEASKRDWHYISVPAKQVEDYNKKTGAGFHVRNYPAGTLPNQKTEVNTFGNYLLLTAHKDFPEDLAYELTKLWVKMGPVVAQYNAMGKIWTPESLSAAARATPNAVHPGAMRAFKELGLVK
ncbi:MAG: TAXI family TRAP transporter solute-binding subunit [Alphaproteobacteria bacterium]|nr:TAXI family TRAP transporter solute-binding subunit [Alphaproteobacteria bacterium]